MLLAVADVDPYETLHARIVTGELSPGERLVEEELAEQLGLSRGAIRTALLRLGDDRLVGRGRNPGGRGGRISAQEAVEILEARAALESLAAGYAAERRTDAEAKALWKITVEMEKLHAGRVQHAHVLDERLELARLALGPPGCGVAGRERLE